MVNDEGNQMETTNHIVMFDMDGALPERELVALDTRQMGATFRMHHCWMGVE